MAKLEFWYDFASTYSYLSAIRIEALAAAAGVEVDWRPFLLGPIFQAQGWSTSPFTLYPAKGRYMIRDLQRVAAARGRVFHMPAVFPAHSLKAARLAIALPTDGSIAAFSRALFVAAFERGEDIASVVTLQSAVSAIGLDFARLSARSEDADVKSALRSQTQTAVSHGIFGAPTFRREDGEIFWGDDRLEQALAWPRRL